MPTRFAFNTALAAVSNFICAAAISTQAQTTSLVVPPAFENADGVNGSGVLREVIRLQEAYGASYFPNHPITIREIHFRPSTIAGNSFTSSIANIQINLSTTTRPAENLSATFATNTGVDDTVVFNGAIQLSSRFTGPVSGPKGFDIIIPLTTPFVYNPAAGNLLVDFRNKSGSSVSWVDVAGVGGDQASRAISHNINGTQATTLDTGADILKIVFDAPPTNPPPVAPVVISGLAVMGTQTNGNWTGDTRWNTVGNDNVVSFFVTKGDDFFAPFINGPADSQAAVSILDCIPAASVRQISAKK